MAISTMLPCVHIREQAHLVLNISGDLHTESKFASCRYPSYHEHEEILKVKCVISVAVAALNEMVKL